MRICAKLSSTPVLCMALAIGLFPVTVFSQDAAAERSATEILAESNAAMSQSLKYRHIMNDREMVVYQKMLPDGSMATLTDISSPRHINIAYGDKNYQLYLDHRVAIDMEFMYQGAIDQAASLASTLGDGVAQSSKVMRTVQRDGKECYEIESTITADSLAALGESLSPEAMNAFPVKHRYVIEKDTFLKVERESISQDGSSLSRVEYRDVKPQSDLSDDFFQVPDGFEVKKPKTTEEYIALAGDILSPEPKVRERPQRPPLTPRREPELGLPAHLQERIDEMRKRANHAKETSPKAMEIPSKSMSTVRKIVIVVSILAFIALMAVFVVLRRLKRAR